ncbi:MAG TPA: DEAD/DEAH box helicase [Bacillus bacterium]|nr:DEAD/DEAH box helicase [Bacillus sp. (in: firmicutes)]
MKNFISIGISEELTQTLKEHGITEPTPIQEKAIPLLMDGKDIIAQSQTGTGKTFAFILPILEKLDPENPSIQALIVTPTRELALQITHEINKLIENIEGINILAVYGGQDVASQLKKLKKNIHIVIATPGRLLDHIRRETVDFSKTAFLVLDEADQMLHIGFLDEVEEIIKQIPKTRQTLLFSATMPDEIRKLAKRHMYKPENIQIEKTQAPLANIKQIAISTVDRAKQNDLIESLRMYQPFLAVIFCRTKRRVTKLNDALRANGFNCDELHGDLSQAKREQVMKKFREAKIQYLVATDVAARGLDVEGVTHVFNYDMPLDTESYIHRIGRTGRAGNEGLAVTYYSPKDKSLLQQIESELNNRIDKKNMGNARKIDSKDDERAEKSSEKSGRPERSSTRSTRTKNSDFKGKNTRNRRAENNRQERGGRTGSLERDHRGEIVSRPRITRDERNAGIPARNQRDERPRRAAENRDQPGSGFEDGRREQPRQSRGKSDRSRGKSEEKRQAYGRNDRLGNGQRNNRNEKQSDKTDRMVGPRTERTRGDRPIKSNDSRPVREGKHTALQSDRQYKGMNKKSGSQNRRNR